MFDIGFLELVVVGVIALIVLGPERLPHAARTAGRWVGKIKRMVRQVSEEVDKQLKAEELREKLKQEGDTLGLEHIEKTVADALEKAKEFKDQVETDSAVSPKKPD